MAGSQERFLCGWRLAPLAWLLVAVGCDGGARRFEPGRWHLVEHRIRMNTPASPTA